MSNKIVSERITRHGWKVEMAYDAEQLPAYTVSTFLPQDGEMTQQVQCTDAQEALSVFNGVR